MIEVARARLAARTSGRVWTPTAADHAGYDEERTGFNLALDHRPDVVLAAATSADVVEGIRFAAEENLPVDVQATGHGAHKAMDGGLLITTRRHADVQVDAVRQVARIPAGATSGEVIAAAAPHGLAAPVGAAPGVGYLAYTIGGGLGPMGRAHGYAADCVRRLDVVAADGRELIVTPEQHEDLFWALRGGGGNLAAVTSIEIDLLPVAEIFGGGLFFNGDQAPELLDGFRRTIATATPEMSLSLAFVAFPDLPGVPPPLQGRFCGHVRVGYLGAPATGDDIIAPLRAAGPFLDTVRVLRMTEIGSIHADPVGPMSVSTNSLALVSDDLLDDLAPVLQPDAPFMLELRHLGGALAGPPRMASAVGHRDAVLNLFTSAYPGSPPTAADAQQQVCDTLASSSAGGPLRNFLPQQYPDATDCYEAATAARLAQLKATWDPTDMFRFTPGVRTGQTN